jgi:hypothetical protein
MVHKGFLMAWTEVADNVMVAVKGVLDGLTDLEREKFQVFVTGWSPSSNFIQPFASLSLSETNRMQEERPQGGLTTLRKG